MGICRFINYCLTAFGFKDTETVELSGPTTITYDPDAQPPISATKEQVIDDIDDVEHLLTLWDSYRQRKGHADLFRLWNQVYEYMGPPDEGCVREALEHRSALKLVLVREYKDDGYAG